MQAKSISTVRLDTTVVLATLVLHGALIVLKEMLFGLRNELPASCKAKGVFAWLSSIDRGDMKIDGGEDGSRTRLHGSAGHFSLYESTS
jgi:hypothetical protein